MKPTALSGRCPTKEQQADQDALRSLACTPEVDFGEISTLADRFVNIDAIANATANATTNGTDINHATANATNATNVNPASANTADASNSEKGILSAEAILNTTVTSPTGTQVVSTLNVSQDVIDSFASLREFAISPAHKRLAKFVPNLQETYGRKNHWANASACNGYYAILDPMMLAAYVPYAEEVIDLRDEQIIECFHALSEVDGYPTVHGVPLWERQEWERVEHYNLFKLFRDMRYAFYNESDALVVNRSQNVLARVTRVATQTVNYLSVIHNWPLRVQLYDMWMQSMQDRRVAVKRNLMLDRHAKISQKLITKAFKYLDRAADKMTPKDAIAMLQLGLEYERISIGLPGDKPDVVTSSGKQPLISVVNQTNTSTGPMQINNEGNAAAQLQEDIKKPDTLLSILSVLQRSGAFDAMAQKAIAENPNTEEVIDVEEVSDNG